MSTNENIQSTSTSALKIGATLLRTSSLKQSGNNSFKIQLDAIRKYSKEKGYYIPDNLIFVEDGVSAFKTPASKRKALNQMKQAVLTHNVDALFFYDFSRIDRKIYSFVSEFYYDVIKKKPHIKFFATTKLDNWTPDDLDVKLQFLISNSESLDKSRRAIDSQINDLSGKDSKRPGSTAPYGYNQIDKKLIPNEKAPILLFIFHLSSWGYSTQKIAEVLNDAGIPSPTEKEKWHSSTIDEITKNPVYLGDLKWTIQQSHKEQKEFLLENSHKPIVPLFLYELIEQNRTLKKTYNKLETPFLFAGLLTCKKCNQKLQHRNSSTKKNGMTYLYQKYQCKNCHYDLDLNKLNPILLKSIRDHFSVSFRINTETISNVLQTSIDNLQQEMDLLKITEQEILRNEQMAESTKLNLNSLFRNVKAKIDCKKEQLEQHINKLHVLLTPSELDAFLANLHQLDFSKLSNTEVRVILLYFIKSIVVDFTPEQAKFDPHFKINPVSFLTSSIK